MHRGAIPLARPSRRQGYHAAVYGQKTYNGVAILSTTPPSDVERGLPDGEDDAAGPGAGRHRRTGTRVLSVVRAQRPVRGHPRVPRTSWPSTARFVATWTAGYESEPAAVAVRRLQRRARGARRLRPGAAGKGRRSSRSRARGPQASWRPSASSDTFRRHHPEPGRYSWWDYRMLGFPKNHGLRHRPRLRRPGAGRALRGGGHRPRGAEGQAALGPRPGLGPLPPGRGAGRPLRLVRVNTGAPARVSRFSVLRVGFPGRSEGSHHGFSCSHRSCSSSARRGGLCPRPHRDRARPRRGIAHASTTDTFEIGGQADHWGVRVTDDQILGVQPDFALARTDGEIRGRAMGVPVVVGFHEDEGVGVYRGAPFQVKVERTPAGLRVNGLFGGAIEQLRAVDGPDQRPHRHVRLGRPLERQRRPGSRGCGTRIGRSRCRSRRRWPTGRTSRLPGRWDSS